MWILGNPYLCVSLFVADLKKWLTLSCRQFVVAAWVDQVLGMTEEAELVVQSRWFFFVVPEEDSDALGCHL